MGMEGRLGACGAPAMSFQGSKEPNKGSGEGSPGASGMGKGFCIGIQAWWVFRFMFTLSYEERLIAVLSVFRD